VHRWPRNLQPAGEYGQPSSAALLADQRSRRIIDDTIVDDIADNLRTAIVRGDLQPNERLVEADLSRRFGTGRSGIRTALARLEQEGLVQSTPHRGARVRLVDEQEAIEIYEARAVLEGLAARLAATRASKADVEDLRTILLQARIRLDQADLLGACDKNAALHRRLTEIANHPTASRLIAELTSRVVRFRQRTILLPGRSQRSYDEHAKIVEAVADRQAWAAEAAMRTHLSHVADALRDQGS
jgi:DNA-binding GntR family transcriptional regulator